MTRYANLGGNSNVSAYEYGPDYITVEFSNSSRYTYSYESAGEFNIESMKKLADRGQGLNSYINVNVKYKYVR